MIGTLARKRTNWVALAVLAALTVALFAATVSSQTGRSITSGSDSDFLINEGGFIDVTVSGDGVTIAQWTFQPIFGFAMTASGSATTAYTGGAARYTHQAGAPVGDFTIRATHASLPAVEKKLTVGDAGTNLATVNVKLGTLNAADNTRYDPAADPAETPKPEEATSAVDTNILIEVEALNSNGEKSNTGAAGGLSVTIFAVGGLVASGDDAASGATSATVASTAAQQNVIQLAVTRLTAAGPGEVRVFAVAEVGDETVESGDLNLTFTAVAGPPANPSVADGGAVAQGGASLEADDNGTAITPAVAATRTSLAVSATDAMGVDATLAAGTITTTTVKGPDDKAVTDNGITDVAVSRFVLDADTDTAGNQSVVVVTLAADAAPGEYTVTASIGATASEAATFTVTGPPTNVDVVIEAADGTGLGAQITATATVTDTNDNLVAPVDVAFTVAAGSPASFVGIDTKTKDGVASRNAVVTGSGVITVIATANGVSGVAVIAAGGAADAAADGPSLGDFSRTSGVASYTGPDATASDLLALLAGRATIIWLSDGENWTAYYALIDGSEAPGSSNFTVTSGDVLYIGN